MLKSFKMYESQEEWDADVEATQKKLYENTRRSNLAAFAADIIAERLGKNRYHYLEFGVYWYALKEALAAHGYVIGDETDEEMRDAYKGKTHAHTFVAAEAFKTFYRKHYFQGTRDFALDDDDGRVWTLFDRDIESA